MAKRPTIRDVAREAGVSVATVNRVLAGAANVREETGHKVAEAARRIGYHAANLIDAQLRRHAPEIRLGVLLHKERQAFYQSFAARLREAAARESAARIDLQIDFATGQAPADVAAQLVQLGGKAQVVAATAVNHPATASAVEDLKARGVETIALLSDFAQGLRLAYMGLNNLKVGRGAARMIAAVARRPGKVALFVGGHRWHGHDLRETGFRGVIREIGHGFTLLDTQINLETRELTREAVLELADRHPDLSGLYLAGGGMEGAIAALREVRTPGEVALVVNEWTRDSMSALADGHVALVIETPLEVLATDLIRTMTALALGANPDGAGGQRFLAPRLHLPEFD